MRLYNKDAKDEDIRKVTDKEYALYNTMFLFGEVFGWFEVPKLPWTLNPSWTLNPPRIPAPRALNPPRTPNPPWMPATARAEP